MSDKLKKERHKLIEERTAFWVEAQTTGNLRAVANGKKVNKRIIEIEKELRKGKSNKDLLGITGATSKKDIESQ